MSISEVIRAAERLHKTSAVLSDFAAWPQDLQPGDIHPYRYSAVNHLMAADLSALPATQPLIDAILANADCFEWKQTYTEDEVGADFLSRFAYFELYGPTGAFHSESALAYIGYWGENLFYDWHHHQAEELYFTLAGSAQFKAYGRSDVIVQAGETRAHLAHQPHAMLTEEVPILSYVIWRGPGLAGLPKMGAAA